MGNRGRRWKHAPNGDSACDMKTRKNVAPGTEKRMTCEERCFFSVRKRVMCTTSTMRAHNQVPSMHQVNKINRYLGPSRRALRPRR